MLSSEELLFISPTSCPSVYKSVPCWLKPLLLSCDFTRYCFLPSPTPRPFIPLLTSQLHRSCTFAPNRVLIVSHFFSLCCFFVLYCFFYSFSHLKCPWFDAPEHRLRRKGDERWRWRERATTVCIWQRKPSIIVLWSVCACVCVRVWVSVHVCLLEIMVALEIEFQLWSCKVPP